MLVRKHHGFKKLFDFDGPQCILICSRIFALCVSFFFPLPTNFILGSASLSNHSFNKKKVSRIW